MRFEKLRLLGFKSFVEPTEFIIEGGLTGVVGPNGCGKSNLVEALRWVMGESSYKNMRASGMDDVIFSGSGGRPSRNTAEVSLFLDNADRTAPAAFNQDDTLQVTRRIEREAGSAYKINGRDARAKDVQLLFADQSTGARSPSMVGQGRIGELIQAKPQARRALLEEAAGISGLHSRRHDAELRLRGAETNLERLEDVVGELESQIESLKRQARQANRFKALSRDVRQAEATLLHLKWTLAKAQEAEAQTALASATSLVGERAQLQMEAAKVQAIAQKKLPELRDVAASASAALQRLTIALNQLDEDARRQEARRGELEARIAQLGADIEREEGMKRENAEAIERLAAEEAELTAEEAATGDREAELKKLFEAAEAALARSESELSRLTGERAEAGALRTQLERRIRETGERGERLARQYDTLVSELSAIEGRIRDLADPTEKRALLDAAESAAADAEAAVTQAESTLAAAREAEAERQPALAEARTRLNGLETEARTLSKMLNAGSADLFPAVVEQIKVEKGFEAALGAAIGDDLDLPLDGNAPAYWSGAAAHSDDPALPQGVEGLGDHVKAPDALRRRLNQIGIVEDHEQGASLAESLKTGQRLVSCDGALWRWDGYTARADAPTPAAQRLAQKNRLAELDAEIIEATKALRTSENAASEAGAATAAAADEERRLREAVKGSQTEVRYAREALAAAERATGELSKRKAVLDEGLVRAKADMDEAAGVLAEAETALSGEPDLTELDGKVERQNAIVLAERAALTEARANHQSLSREKEARQRRLVSLRSERENWLSRAANADRQIEVLTARKTATSGELAAMDDAPDEMPERRRQLVREIEKAEQAQREGGDALALAETAARHADSAATDSITALSAAREERARSEERLTAAAERRKDIETRIREALNCAPHEAFKMTGLTSGDTMPDVDVVERRLDKLKIERERLGAVNLRAEEEQAELVERLESLVRERDDVIEAIRELRTAISSLNREGRERLLEAFEIVDAHFKRLFTHLFGGGTADLQLIESDDPLEAGLEIVARPPGKKPQTMTLLSGGEQALTAMALIFAVFLTNPAPICVLDEVDAPLDDHNVVRFCNLMDEMSRETDTRFVIITHNPITMARMDRLFGVTMAEQGVSQLVSVDLQQAEELREAS
ncbi:chromosome segregation protein SMC [Oricola cellulosilytica]|uniref:Chromosome partition protein Smc n=1 Tax=Oricola cellulosilytica TaxID=1429082 RepID=A0A4R0P5Z3_9HYPH|nr:chromosome segregation protein SMC [Oricola cellulosilytica]TCD11286.1 chromosome segregation protein SMC [Oricola cellulosilytica]